MRIPKSQGAVLSWVPRMLLRELREKLCFEGSRSPGMGCEIRRSRGAVESAAGCARVGPSHRGCKCHPLQRNASDKGSGFASIDCSDTSPSSPPSSECTNVEQLFPRFVQLPRPSDPCRSPQRPSHRDLCCF